MGKYLYSKCQTWNNDSFQTELLAVVGNIHDILAIFMTVSTLEPDFKISFTLICKTKVSNSFSCKVGFI